MHLTMLRVLALGSLCVGVISCSTGSDNAAGAISIFGQVRTEDGAALTDTKVCFVGTTTCVSSDASGHYKKAYDNKLPEPVVVQFTKPGYARKIVRMHNATLAQAGVVLRKIDTQVTIALPQAGQSPVIVEAMHDDSRSALSIGAASLVDGDGVVAAGNANVSLTYFHPLQNLQGAPGALNAENGKSIKGLFTWGMADIEIEQNGALLQVAPNQTLGWNILEPPAVASALSPNGIVTLPLPDLYSLSPNTGLWHLEGTASSGSVSYDADSTTVMTRLPHLSSWNVDSDAGPNYGGCVSGRIIDPCGKPVGGKAITVWFLGFEQLKDWTGTVTASDGTFCTPTYLSGFNVSANRTNINYFVAGADSVSDTSMCNPAPASCFNCVDEQAPYSTMGWCTNCYLDPTSSQPANYQTEPPTYYSNTCNAPSIDLVPYSQCGGSGCNALGDIVLNSTTCDTPVTPNSTGGTATPPDPCTDGTGKHLGDACTSNDVCCPRNLVCQDLLCIPPKDGD